SPQFFSKCKSGVANYVRLRLVLAGELKWLFAREVTPSDWPFVTSFYRNKIVEFRLNEKRNFPDEIKRLYSARDRVLIEAVHYFLIRDVRVELARSHTDFRKMRKLEPNLWKGYLREFGNVNFENMIIYHWRKVARDRTTCSRGPTEIADGKLGVDDFIALCSFRELRGNVLLYIAAIVLLGAIGNSTQAFFTASFRASGISDALLQLRLFTGFALALAAIYISVSLVAYLGSFAAFTHRRRLKGQVGRIMHRLGLIRGT
ncbi:MAG: hypothetical protein KGO48_08825, partial [Alphaproteobacteria bacterium]|nr:hypothetical protein [Alphaproteobacteria bacterium]